MSPFGIKAAIIAAAFLFVTGAVTTYNHVQQQKGALKVMVADDVRVAKLEKARADSIERRFRVDTVKLVRSTHSVDTLLQHRVDTALVYHSDTVKITVKEATAIQDTIRACVATVRECADGWAHEKAARVAVEAENARIRRLMPSGAGTWLWRGLAFAGGIATGRLMR